MDFTGRDVLWGKSLRPGQHITRDRDPIHCRLISQRFRTSEKFRVVAKMHPHELSIARSRAPPAFFLARVIPTVGPNPFELRRFPIGLSKASRAQLAQRV